MHISDKGLALVRAFESCLEPDGNGKFRAYLCPAKKLTIGWGHTNDHGMQFNAGTAWTQAECDAELASDMKHFEAVVDRLVKVELNQSQYDALVSFAYNCGDGALAGSTLLRKVNAGDFEGAAREFPRWNKGGGVVLKGLVRRRASEALMFQGIADEDFDGQPDKLIVQKPQEPMPQQVDAPEEKPLSQSTISTGAKVGTTIAGGGFIAEIVQQLSGVPQSAFDLLSNLGHNPLVLAVIGAGGVFIYIDHRRSMMKKEQGV
jgi:lysozyme